MFIYSSRFPAILSSPPLPPPPSLPQKPPSGSSSAAQDFSLLPYRSRRDDFRHPVLGSKRATRQPTAGQNELALLWSTSRIVLGDARRAHHLEFQASFLRCFVLRCSFGAILSTPASSRAFVRRILLNYMMAQIWITKYSVLSSRRHLAFNGGWEIQNKRAIEHAHTENRNKHCCWWW